jgi:thymidylate kinase
MAYGASDDLDMAWIQEVNSQLLIPNPLFLLQVSPKECIKRLNLRGNQRDHFK